MEKELTRSDQSLNQESGETIFQKGKTGRGAGAQIEATDSSLEKHVPESWLRKVPPSLPEVSELQVVRHFTNLSKKNFAIDSQFYPLGSCTMKYNPRGAHKAASHPGFLHRHPLAPEQASQGIFSSLYWLQEILAEVTGMKGVSLAPMAGAQGEFAGVAMIKAYHEGRSDDARSEIIVPTAAHGTNPATAVMCGYNVREIPVNSEGDIDIQALREAVGPQTAGLMMTNPSTCGVFERKIEEIADIVHEAGGLLYYDGANLNAILGKARPGDMGFDVLHMNLHKTFATPHGGGGPGAGPVGVGEKLLPFLPVPLFRKVDGVDESYDAMWEKDCAASIGRLSAFGGNSGILLRALSYALLLGREGFTRVSEFSTLNANYMAARLKKLGFHLAYPNRRASHEFIVSLQKEFKETGVNAMDFAKRLLDFGVHSPTTYFPLLVPECFLIEPTETETKEELDGFIRAMEKVRSEMMNEPEFVRGAPYNTPIRRLDDVKAARDLDLAWHGQPREVSSAVGN